MLSYFVKRKVIAATLFVFLFLVLISQINPPKAIDPIGDALADFNPTDFVFQEGFREQSFDTNIVVVNLGRVNRAEVGKIIQNVERYKPAVIGIDALYRKLQVEKLNSDATAADTADAIRQDSTLAATLAAHKNIVMVTELSGYDTKKKEFTTVLTSNPLFNQHVQNGYANITNDGNSLRTIRAVSPQEQVGQEKVPSFGIALMRFYKPELADKCLARKNRQEMINWHGSIPNFFLIDTPEALDSTSDLSLVKGKIVLMAFVDLNETGRSLEDLYFTPMNEQIAGKALPDLYGIYVHANFLAMMTKDAYIDHMPKWLGIVLGIFFTHLFLSIFAWIDYQYPKLQQLVVRTSQLLLSLGIVYVLVIIFYLYHYEIDTSVLLIGLVVGPDIQEIFLPFWDRISEGRLGKLVQRLISKTHTTQSENL